MKLFLVVLYNKLINDSQTINQLLKCHIKDILIIDNSEQRAIIKQNELIAKEQNLKYIANHQNLGLSKAYNKAIAGIDPNQYQYVVLLDDDTIINDDYLHKVQNLSYQENTIYVPYVYNQLQQLTSPCYHDDNFLKEHLIKPKYMHKDKLKQLENTNLLYGINSGMIIPLSFFHQFQYNENIFLDCVDHYCCQQAYQLGYNIKIIDAQLSQNYNTQEIAQNSFEQNKKRLLIRLHDIKNYQHKYYFTNKLVCIMMYVLNTKDLRYLQFIFV